MTVALQQKWEGEWRENIERKKVVVGVYRTGSGNSAQNLDRVATIYILPRPDLFCDASWIYVAHC